MTEGRIQELRREGEYIHRAIFSSNASEVVLNHYLTAHNKLPHLNHVQQSEAVHKIIDLGLDIEACEIVLRGRDHLLCRKVLLMTYICETQSDYNLVFQLKNKRAFGSFLIEFLFFGLATIFKIIKGHWFLWRHTIV